MVTLPRIERRDMYGENMYLTNDSDCEYYVLSILGDLFFMAAWSYNHKVPSLQTLTRAELTEYGYKPTLHSFWFTESNMKKLLA